MADGETNIETKFETKIETKIDTNIATAENTRASRRRRRGVVGIVGAGAVVAVASIAGIRANDDDRSTAPAALVPAEAEPSTPGAVVRTTDAGIEIRLLTDDRIPRGRETSAAADVPGLCRVTGLAQATAIGTAAVATAQTLLRAETSGRGSVAVGVSGVLERDPLLSVVLQVPFDVTEVTLSTPAGSDAMSPVGGVAALAAPAPEDLALAFSAFGAESDVPSFDSIVVELHRRDGSTVALTGEDLAGGAGALDPTCAANRGLGLPEETAPVATLPPAGVQPADPAAAERDVRTAFLDAYAIGAAGDQRRLRALDDSSGVQQMIDLVRADANRRPLEPSALAVTEVVFTDETEAWFRYDLTLPGGARFDDQLGRARLVDGRWTISRATVCADWAKVGADCGP